MPAVHIHKAAAVEQQVVAVVVPAAHSRMSAERVALPEHNRMWAEPALRRRAAALRTQAERVLRRRAAGLRMNTDPVLQRQAVVLPPLPAPVRTSGAEVLPVLAQRVRPPFQ